MGIFVGVVEGETEGVSVGSLVGFEVSSVGADDGTNDIVGI